MERSLISLIAGFERKALVRVEFEVLDVHVGAEASHPRVEPRHPRVEPSVVRAEPKCDFGVVRMIAVLVAMVTGASGGRQDGWSKHCRSQDRGPALGRKYYKRVVWWEIVVLLGFEQNNGDVAK